MTHCRSFRGTVSTGQMTQPTASKHRRKPANEFSGIRWRKCLRSQQFRRMRWRCRPLRVAYDGCVQWRQLEVHESRHTCTSWPDLGFVLAELLWMTIASFILAVRAKRSTTACTDFNRLPSVRFRNTQRVWSWMQTQVRTCYMRTLCRVEISGKLFLHIYVFNDICCHL